VHSVSADGSGNHRPAVPGQGEAQYGGRCIAVCLTAIMVDASCLLQVSDRGLRNKFLKGTPHQMEIDRLIGATCDVFGQPVMYTQLDRDMLVFTTAAGTHDLLFCLIKILTFIWLAASDAQMSTGSNKTYIRSSSICSPVKPSYTSSSSKPRPDFVKAVLAANDEGVIFVPFLRKWFLTFCNAVPVYDAREQGFNFASDFDNLDGLPRFREEIPLGSFVVVAYMMSSYVKYRKGEKSKAEDPNRDWHLSMNIQFAILFATPE